jgi:hypothetical protein
VISAQTRCAFVAREGRSAFHRTVTRGHAFPDHALAARTSAVDNTVAISVVEMTKL